MITGGEPWLQIKTGIIIPGATALASARWEAGTGPGWIGIDEGPVNPELDPVVEKDRGQIGGREAIRLGDVYDHSEIEKAAAASRQRVIARRTQLEFDAAGGLAGCISA